MRFPRIEEGYDDSTSPIPRTVPACSRLLGSRERHASPRGPDGAEPPHAFRQRQAPAPLATVMGCDWALPWLFGAKSLAFVRVGGGGRGFKRRVAFAAHSFMRWPAFWCLPGPAPSEFTAGVPGDEGPHTAYYLPAVAARGFECGAERVPAAFGCLAQRFSASKSEPLTAFRM
ncbi:hypothetical protein TcBrA4_0051820 [Trypanosoma cruzi]|nr:hypothetical protein TcBrA4_0051820 [Trypanosoma cruzi]